MNQDICEVIKQLTLEEKAGLCSGSGFWNTKSVERIGIPQIMMTDGPHGLRKQKDTSDHLGISQSVPATCFPTAATTSCSFDRELLKKIGIAIAEEMLQENVSILLGPGVNIKRSPLCGRNFEYFSEDPFVAGELAAALVQGIQSQGVGACLKHYAANNQETARMINDSIVDERALREIYLRAFEIAVKKAQPWTMMCAYNKINGTYACEHKYLLNDIARDEWGFEGLIMTDWGAMDDRVWALESGLDLEMPYTGSKNDQSIIEAVNCGELDEQVLDQAVSRLLEIVKKQRLNDKFGKDYDVTAHDQLARQAVCESAVLLKNDDKVCPVEKHESIAIIGEFAEKPRYQGAGSSKINPHRITSALETLDNEGISYEYARGYDLTKKDDPKLLIQQAVALAKGKDKVIIYAGLPDEYESEGFDRTTINLPDVQNDLIRKIVEVNPNVIVFLHNGSAVGMPWLDHVKGILLLGLGGQSVGAASVDLMFGKSNPSGKLSETYPILLEDNPSFWQFGERLQTEYRESIYVGYRYYEKASKQVLFPFGHGLSYTEFEYDDLRISKNNIWDNETLKVTFTIRNVGSVKGKEVIQLYVSPPESTLFKPKKELREFCKVALEPGEEEELTIELGKSAFAYWNTNINDWHVESGIYHILVGSSSRDIRVQTSVEVRSTNEDTPIPDFRKTAPVYYNLSRGVLKIPQDQFNQIYGKAFPSKAKEGKRPFTKNSTFFDAQDTLVGKFFINSFRKQLKKFLGQGDQDDPMMLMMESMILDFPLRAFGILGLSNEKVEGMLDLLNRKFFRGIKKMIKSSHPKEEG